MSNAPSTQRIHRRLRIGGADLLPDLGNPPISNSVMASQRTHVLTLKGHIKVSDPVCNRHPHSKPRSDSLNPHSAVATNEPMSPRPRGFLP
jgi:hypothetical protein